MLSVNEIFGPTIQGEGKNTGKPVSFLRLANCNLHCFKCDTPFTWYFEGSRATHVNGVQFNKQAEVHQMSEQEVVAVLVATGMKHLVVSGGEPFLQQKQLIPLFKLLKALDWFIEVETNGTVMPNPEFVELINQINCSPKLEGSFSGEPLKLRIRQNALAALTMIDKLNWKFVIAEPENITEALQLVSTFGMKEVRLMPECQTAEELHAKEAMVRALCDEHGFIYCTRLSIELSGTQRGV